MVRVQATISCKAFRVRGEDDGRVTLEIEDATPGDFLPRLLKRADAAGRLGVSARHFDALCKKHRIKPVADLPVRFREADLLPLTTPANALAVVPLPRPAAKTIPASGLQKPTAPLSQAKAAADAPRQRIRLSL